MNRRNGFTLVELVVVILILGILAGVAAPKMFKTSADANENGVKQSLAVVRSAIELCYANTQAYPTCDSSTDFWGDLKNYLRGPSPKSPFGLKDASVKSGTFPFTADNSSDWMYDPGTGDFICNSTEDSATRLGLKLSDF